MGPTEIQTAVGSKQKIKPTWVSFTPGPELCNLRKNYNTGVPLPLETQGTFSL